MKSTVHLAALLAAVFAAGAAQAALSDADYAARKKGIEAEYKNGRATCGSLAGNAKDICLEEAKGRQKVALATLEFDRKPDAKQREKLADARADAAYDVAKERCDDLAGNAKDVCVADAKAARTRAQADAKAEKVGATARSEAAEAKNEAQYKAEVERCDSLAGDAKDACVNAAKARHGRS